MHGTAEIGVAYFSGSNIFVCHHYVCIVSEHYQVCRVVDWMAIKHNISAGEIPFADVGLLWENCDNIMSAVVLAPYVARSPAVMILIM